MIVDRALTLEKDRIRREFMKKLDTIEESEGGLRSTQRIQLWVQRSGETISRYFHRVLLSIIELEEIYLKQPDGTRIAIEILGSNRFNPFFKDCVGAIDCTHVRVKVPLLEAPKYRGRKDFPTQNVLVACSFDLRFTYVLPGWEGIASDSRILKDALHRTNGKYYLLNAGFMLRKGLITPYRSIHYHLKEFSARNPPRTPQELLNMRHSSLRVDPVDDKELLDEVDEEISYRSVVQCDGASINDNDEEHTHLGENLRNSIAATMWTDYQS
ncbi:PREDICTED: uncharacterized protein LOC109329214 [Lupinus angustifolius]|uniref:uncharacterized protein LOC109329214 n=1 Tax=Lupinus angustifolius TaxID=3871 RepID=UPI00092FA213|nr:PREDICTED: uncharacterized protein LOC109329214 [Lupinus angustifolius]